jgi:hypothetical protein
VSIDRIYEQLTQLTLTVDLLEQTIAQKEVELAQAAQQAKAAPPTRAAAPQQAGQIDMFGEWTAGGKAANVNTASALAKKLDSAIENVQWLLKQAEA